MKHHKVLFILKRRQDYSSYDYSANHLATGMYNSAKFVSDMLKDAGIHSKVVIVVDNNDIDREVTNYKATHVFIEGIWVVPEKFDVLLPMHKHVKWIVRCHSEIPFLAQEGNALDWIFQYLEKGVRVSGNSNRVNDTLQSLVGDVFGFDPAALDEMLPLLPNYYPVDNDFIIESRDVDHKDHFDIGCFGAIRPLKNQLMQAIAAVEFARMMGKGLHFHINSGRVEQLGGNQLKNLRALFAHLGTGFELVEHPWMSHKHFLHLQRKMDICMQVSMSETFNIVTADAISVGTPVVVSKEVAWADPETFADPTSVENITDTLESVWEDRDEVAEEGLEHLKKYSHSSKHRWVKYLR